MAQASNIPNHPTVDIVDAEGDVFPTGCHFYLTNACSNHQQCLTHFFDDRTMQTRQVLNFDDRKWVIHYNNNGRNQVAIQNVGTSLWLAARDFDYGGAWTLQEQQNWFWVHRGCEQNSFWLSSEQMVDGFMQTWDCASGDRSAVKLLNCHNSNAGVFHNIPYDKYEQWSTGMSWRLDFTPEYRLWKNSQKWEKLQGWDNDLRQRDNNMQQREQRVQQAENGFQQREREIAMKEQQAQQREQQSQQREQQINARDQQSQQRETAVQKREQDVATREQKSGNDLKKREDAVTAAEQRIQKSKNAGQKQHLESQQENDKLKGENADLKEEIEKLKSERQVFADDSAKRTDELEQQIADLQRQLADAKRASPGIGSGGSTRYRSSGATGVPPPIRTPPRVMPPQKIPSKVMPDRLPSGWNPEMLKRYEAGRKAMSK